MNLLEAFFARLTGYFLIAVMAYKKGWYRLAASAFLLCAITTFNYTNQPSEKLRALLSFIFSLSLLFHVMELPDRRRQK